jgi:hypothetical protein
VIALNVPLMVLAITRGYNVLSLFLVTNLLCCCAVIPIALGLIRRANGFFTETGTVVGIVSGVLGVRRRRRRGNAGMAEPRFSGARCLCALLITGARARAALRPPLMHPPSPPQPPPPPPPRPQLTALGIGLNWNPKKVAASFAAGADWAWYSNSYSWKAFLAALLFSTAGDVIWCALAWAARTHLGIHGPGISGVLLKVPGMGLLTASPGWTRDNQPKGWADAADAVGVAPADGGEKPIIGAAPVAAKDVEMR